MKSVNQYSSQVGFPQVKDTLEVLDFGFKFMNAVTESLADGKVNLLDIPSVLSPLMAAGAAVEKMKVRARLMRKSMRAREPAM